MDVVFLTPVEVEYRVVRSFFQDFRVVNKGGDIYETTYFPGKYHEYTVAIRQTGSKNENVSLAAEKAVQHFSPSILILIGMCGGVKDVRLGDVVVGTKAYGYESTKETQSGPLIRPEVLPYTLWLIDWARHIALQDTWQDRIDGETQAQVTFAPIASGNKVIASTDSPVYRLLKQYYNDTGALEMEAIGFAKAMQRYPQIATLNIRGVSDLLDNKNTSDQSGSQEMATIHAAAFALELLFQLDFKKQTMPGHDPRKIAGKLTALIFPRLLHELGLVDVPLVADTPLSKKVRATFDELIEEEKNGLKERLQELPLQEEAREALTYGIRRKLKQDQDLLQEFARLLEKEDKGSASAKQEIKNSKFVIQDSQISAGGNVRIGDEKIGQQINNNGAIKNQVNIADNKGDLNFD